MGKEKRIFISRDQKTIDEFRDSLDLMIPHIRSFVSLFNKLGVGEIKDSGELYAAYEDWKGFYSKKQFDSFEMNDAFVQMKITKENCIKMRDWIDPKGFYEAVEVVFSKLPWQKCSIKDFVIDEHGAVVIDNELFDAYVEANTVYAETENEIKLHTALTKAADILNEVNSIYKSITGKAAFIKSWSVQDRSHTMPINFITCETNTYSREGAIENITPNFDLISKAQKQKKP
ncbi:hypothetical protein BDD43_3507 [Mucilaginibacter gracilis]|uniref:Uncharacterized protein n=1 Tax=Mucilaginibacter gracilis TaxID=423350 RepID=A0A495J3X8_9SPHI|nr:hypothetical protein [Mucilaginibacter gracilis]RKR83302.1 hypothetical protein BDD43_3507 [Mucilaginibacter gracilis]